jgi:staphylococcal nuclease domain-containing protein 1
VLLAYIQAPKIGRVKDGRTGADEPLSWEAREFVRERIVGKEVRMRTEYTLPASGRELPCVSIFVDESSEQSINELLVAAGLAELNRRKQETAEQASLAKAEADAKQAAIGLWAAEKPQVVRQRVLNELSSETANKLVGQTLTGLVEHVNNGSSFKIGVFMPLDVPVEQRTDYQLMSVHLSGVKSPSLEEEAGQMARYFTESRLLNRQVQVRVEQVPPLNFVSIVGSVTLGERNIALFLLKEGLARTVDRSISLVLGGIEPYRAAERAAKQAKLRLWKNWTAPSVGEGGRSALGGPSNAWTGQVVEIVNAECILVEKAGEDEPVKVWFASIRGPKADANKSAAAPAAKGKDSAGPAVRARPLYDVPYMFEAREFLRRKLIGRPVRVEVDYVQPSANSLPERLCATVYAAEVNIAAALVLKGLATVIKRNDDQKSAAFDDLLQAEAKAIAAGKALYSKTAGKNKLVKPTDVSTDTSRASFQLETLTRGGAKEAVVEFVFSSTKFKVYLVKENLLINLVLGGIQSDKIGKLDTNIPAARKLLQHRDVKITVERVDKAGNFIGQLIFSDASKIDTNLSLFLLRQGWVKVRDDKSSILLEAQREAQQAQRGIWVGWTDTEDALSSSVNQISLNESGDLTESSETKESADKTNGASTLDSSLEKVVVAFVEQNPLRLSIQNYAGAVQLVYLQTELRKEYELNPPHPGTFRGKVGDLCSARFPEDNQWYRARIERLIPSEHKAEVLLIDYGDRFVADVLEEVRNLPSKSRFGLEALPAVARQVGLAFVSLPKDEEWAEEVREQLQTRLLSHSELRLKPQYVNAGGSELVTLLTESNGEDLLLSLVREGYFVVNKRLIGKRRKHADQDFDKYKAAMEQALKARQNLWRYGDVREDDEKD